MPLVEPYITLVSSLPWLHHPLAVRERPLTRVQLDRRLAMLQPVDAATLAAIEGELRWPAIDPTSDDRSRAARGLRLVRQLRHPSLQEAVRERLELRALVAALRRRARGEGPPDSAAALGFHRRARIIAANWESPGFALDAHAPWLPDADRLLRERDTLGLDRLLLRVIWDQLSALARRHAFDFPAVVLYVLRWDLVDRWMRYDGEAARARFDELVTAALRAHGPVHPQEAARHGG